MIFLLYVCLYCLNLIECVMSDIVFLNSVMKLFVVRLNVNGDDVVMSVGVV